MEYVKCFTLVRFPTFPNFSFSGLLKGTSHSPNFHIIASSHSQRLSDFLWVSSSGLLQYIWNMENVGSENEIYFLYNHLNHQLNSLRVSCVLIRKRHILWKMILMRIANIATIKDDIHNFSLMPSSSILFFGWFFRIEYKFLCFLIDSFIFERRGVFKVLLSSLLWKEVAETTNFQFKRNWRIFLKLWTGWSQRNNMHNMHPDLAHIMPQGHLIDFQSGTETLRSLRSLRLSGPFQGEET